MVFGERHDKPDARAVIADLIEQGRVRCLYLEVGTLSDDTNEVSKMSEEDRGNWFMVLGWLDSKHENPIPLVELAKLAIANGAEVVAYDNAVGDQTTMKGMRLRNATMAEAFNPVAGSVALVGGAHLMPQTSGGSWHDTLQGQTAVDLHDRIADLSR